MELLAGYYIFRCWSRRCYRDDLRPDLPRHEMPSRQYIYSPCNLSSTSAQRECSVCRWLVAECPVLHCPVPMSSLKGPRYTSVMDNVSLEDDDLRTSPLLTTYILILNDGLVQGRMMDIRRRLLMIPDLLRRTGQSYSQSLPYIYSGMSHLPSRLQNSRAVPFSMFETAADSQRCAFSSTISSMPPDPIYPIVGQMRFCPHPGPSSLRSRGELAS